MIYASAVSPSTHVSRLWESASILRCPVDAADFATYIFPLLFFKRIGDVWDEEYQQIVDETGDEQLARSLESHRFRIPADCHWNVGRTKATIVGTGLLQAMLQIDKASRDTLCGAFGGAPVIQQGTLVRRAAEGPDRALLEAAFGQAKRYLRSSG